MATVIDSTETPPPAPTIVLTYASEAKLPPDMDLQTALTRWVQEMSSPNVEMIQVGNTVFVGHPSKDKRKLMGRVFNVDTARNFVSNTVKYFKLLQKKGITHYSVSFDTGTLEQIAKAVGKALVGSGIQAGLAPTESGKETVLFVQFPTNIKKAKS